MSSFPPSLSPSYTPRHWGFYSGVSFKGHLWMLKDLKRSLINFNLNEFTTDSACVQTVWHMSLRDFFPGSAGDCSALTIFTHMRDPH